jgi:nitrite reductase/ring-hydroxylating ferredoxin subunit
VTVGSTCVALVNHNGTFFALDNECPHRGAELGDGRLNPRFGEFALECPLHQGCFDVRTGAAVNPPARVPVRTYEVEVDGDVVRVRLGPEAPQ